MSHTSLVLHDDGNRILPNKDELNSFHPFRHLQIKLCAELLTGWTFTCGPSLSYADKHFE